MLRRSLAPIAARLSKLTVIPAFPYIDRPESNRYAKPAFTMQMIPVRFLSDLMRENARYIRMFRLRSLRVTREGSSGLSNMVASFSAKPGFAVI
jgi:hypothetical protein